MDLGQLTKVVAIGQSNTEGFGKRLDGSIEYRRRPWFSQLAELVGRRTRFVNLGRNGSRIDDWLPGGVYHPVLVEPQLDEGVLSEGVPGAGFAFVQLAEAEAICQPHPTATELLANAEALIAELREIEPTLEVLWLGPIKLHVFGPTDPDLQARLVSYDLALRELSVPYVSFYAAFDEVEGLTHTRYLDPDGVEDFGDPWHLTELGHAFVADRVWRALGAL